MSKTPSPRRPFCTTLLLGALAVSLGLSDAPAFAQLPQARLFSIFPAGGKAGKTVELSLTTFDDLDGVDRLRFNHPGITAVPKMQKIGEPVPNVFVVTIRPDVPSGIYEVCAGGTYGLSNPRIFAVGSQEETQETEPNNDPDKPNELVPGRLVNGTIGAATDVDFFRFSGKHGQHIVVTCRASDLDSRLSAVIELMAPDGRRLGYAREELRHDPMIDAVLPEDGSYLIKVHDFLFRGGPEYVYRLSAGNLPYIDYIMPPAGVAGTTGRFTIVGRNLPGGTAAGESVNGRPLARLDVFISLPSVPPLAPLHTTLGSVSAGVKTVSWVFKTPAGESNPVLIELAPTVPVVEKEPNDTPALAQPVSAPGEFAGRFQSPGDTDYYTFHADAGQVFCIDVFAERFGSTADPYLVVEQVVRNAKGVDTATRITSMDDDNSNIAPAVFDTRTDDPNYRFQAPETGTYRIVLRDRSFESRGDPRLVYRVSIRPEQPDFQLVLLPQYPKQGSVKEVSTWALGLRRGDSRELTILVLRRDGFREPIEVWAEDLPKGVTCRGAFLASNAKTADLIFTAAENAPEEASLIRVFGKARLPRKGVEKGAGKGMVQTGEIVREAIPATIVWSADLNVPAISRIAQSLALSVMKEAAPFQLSTPVGRLEVNQSRQILLPFTLARRNGFTADVPVTLVGATAGAFDMKLKSFPKGKSDELVRMFVPRFERPGSLTLYWKMQAKVAYRRNVEGEERAKRERDRAAKEAAEKAARVVKARGQLERAAKTEADSTLALKKAQARLDAEKAKHAAKAILMTMDQKLADAQAALKSAAAAKRHAATDLAQSIARAKAARDRENAATAALSKATAIAAPKELTDFAPSTPVLVTVKSAPIELKADVPVGGAVKKGGRIAIKIDVRRHKGFAGPVTLGLPLPPGVKGIDAKPITVAANQRAGVLTVTADANAKPGPLANLVVRARMNEHGTAEVDAAINLKIIP